MCIRDRTSYSHPKPICRSRLAVVDDPRNEAVITGSIERCLAGRYCFIRNNGHRADRVALNHHITCWPMLDVEERPLSITVLQVFDIHPHTRFIAVVNKLAATRHEPERRIVDHEYSAASALIEAPVDCQRYIVDIHGNIIK